MGSSPPSRSVLVCVPRIAASWPRSISADLQPDRFDVPYEPDSGDAGHPAADVAIVGTRNADHVADAVAAADLVLSASDRRRIEAVMAHAAPVGGPSPEAMP